MANRKLYTSFQMVPLFIIIIVIMIITDLYSDFRSEDTEALDLE